jgi:hypothetical protein
VGRKTATEGKGNVISRWVDAVGNILLMVGYAPIDIMKD